MSEPVGLSVTRRDVLAIDLHLASMPAVPESSVNPFESAYIAPGEAAGNEGGKLFSRRVSTTGDELSLVPLETSPYRCPSFLITAVEVRNARPNGVVVVAGDSMNFGRWPEWLFAGFNRQFGDAAPSVVQTSNSGQKLCRNTSLAPSLVDLFEQSLLDLSGITHVILNIGYNHLALPALADPMPVPTPFKLALPDDVSSRAMIRTFRDLIARSHRRGLKITGCTTIRGSGVALDYRSGTGRPQGISILPEWWPRVEAIRQEVNQWILAGGEFDSVIDLAPAVANPHDTSAKAPGLTDDGVHPNAGGCLPWRPLSTCRSSGTHVFEATR